MITYFISLYIMSALYILAGITHFTQTRFFRAIVPHFLPYKVAIVYVSGVFEILLGICLLFPFSRVEAAWGIIVLLIVIYPANIYMLMIRIQKKKFIKIPIWTLWVRLLLQFGLVYWAWIYTFGA